MKNIMPGWRWEEKIFEYKDEWRMEEENMDPEDKTSKEMKKVMDSTFPMLNFKMETPTMFQGTQPTLDFSCYSLGREHQNIIEEDHWRGDSNGGKDQSSG